MSDDYKVNGKEYSMMSPTNERILNRLVNNNVYCNMTQEIEFIINALLEGANDSSAPFDMNDYDAAIENGMEHVCEDCGACDDFESARHLVTAQVNSERCTLLFDEHLQSYAYENDNDAYVWPIGKDAYDWWHIYFIEE